MEKQIPFGNGKKVGQDFSSRASNGLVRLGNSGATLAHAERGLALAMNGLSRFLFAMLLVASPWGAAPALDPTDSDIPLNRAPVSDQVRKYIGDTVVHAVNQNPPVDRRASLSDVFVTVMERRAKEKSLLVATTGSADFCGADVDCPTFVFHVAGNKAQLVLEGYYFEVPSKLKQRHHGLPDLEAVVRGGGYSTYRMEFDGVRYRNISCTHLVTSVDPPVEEPCGEN